MDKAITYHTQPVNDLVRELLSDASDTCECGNCIARRKAAAFIEQQAKRIEELEAELAAIKNVTLEPVAAGNIQGGRFCAIWFSKKQNERLVSISASFPNGQIPLFSYDQIAAVQAEVVRLEGVCREYRETQEGMYGHIALAREALEHIRDLDPSFEHLPKYFDV